MKTSRSRLIEAGEVRRLPPSWAQRSSQAASSSRVKTVSANRVKTRCQVDAGLGRAVSRQCNNQSVAGSSRYGSAASAGCRSLAPKWSAASGIESCERRFRFVSLAADPGFPKFCWGGRGGVGGGEHGFRRNRGRVVRTAEEEGAKRQQLRTPFHRFEQFQRLTPVADRGDHVASHAKPYERFGTTEDAGIVPDRGHALGQPGVAERERLVAREAEARPCRPAIGLAIAPVRFDGSRPRRSSRGRWSHMSIMP